MKPQRFIKIAALAASFLAAPAMMAQEQQEQQEQQVQQEFLDSLAAIYDDLDELVVVAKKDVIKSDGANLTYDMSADPSSKGQTLLDALRKVPMVTVDGEDNVYIKGSSNFKVYTNGKEDPMLSANYKTMFKAMPAESVKKIEVITEPGARYDAEGSGGILNLVTEVRQTRDGYTGSVSLSGSNRNAGGFLYGRMRKGNFTADLNANYTNSVFADQESLQHMDLINNADDVNHHQTTDMEQRFKFRYAGGGLNLSWEPSKNDLFSAGGDVSWMSGDVTKLTTVNSMYNRAGKLIWSTSQDGSVDIKDLNASGNAAYRHNFGRVDNSLSVAYRFNFGNTGMDLSYLNSLIAGDVTRMPYEKSKNDNYIRQHTVNADYENVLAGKHTLQTGVKGVFRRNSNLSLTEYGTDENNMMPSTDGDGHVNQVQDIYAIYAAYKGMFGNFSANAGLRYEHTHMGLDFRDRTYPNFRANLDDVVPDAAVAYMFAPANTLRLAYQMRIWRPTVNQMNPTVFKVTENYATVGNPDLSSERYNSVSLTYSNFGRVLGGNVSATYSRSDNTIESLEYVEDAVIYNTYGNFGRKNTFNLTGFLNWNITPKMSASVSGSLIYDDVKDVRHNLHNSGWNGNYNITWNYSGPWRMNYNVYGGQSTGNVFLQGKSHGWYYYGLSVKKNFLKDDALSVTVNAGNFFTKYQKYISESVMGDYSRRNESRSRNWYVGLSISWNFGHLKDEVKQAGRGIDTNDTKKTEKSSGGIGI